MAEQQPSLAPSPLPATAPSAGWDLGLGLLQPEGPLDAFLDGVLSLAVHAPLRFAVALAGVVAGAAFLALVRWAGSAKRSEDVLCSTAVLPAGL